MKIWEILIQNDAGTPSDRLEELVEKIKEERPRAYSMHIWTRIKNGKEAITYSTQTRPGKLDGE